MLEVADILRLHGPAYRQTHRLLPSHQRALDDLIRCRTPAAGGQLWQCDHDGCGYQRYSYHSCGNRHCPKCHGQQTQRWLEKQREQLLPCAYYFLTFTVPAELRALIYAHQKALYGLLLASAAAALQKLAWDPKYVGAQLGILAVLHTWRRDLRFHPHAHLLVTAGGLSRDGQWVPPQNPAFLVPCFALGPIFRGKFRAGLQKLGLLDQVPATVWNAKWVVHCRHAGRGEKVLEYLGRYAFRVALSNSALENLEHDQVTFRYRDNRTQQLCHCTLGADAFLARFCQHILPKGFVKVRAYGLWHANTAAKRQRAHDLLAPNAPPAPADSPPPSAPQPPCGPLCPVCKTGHLVLIASLLPQRTRAP